MITIHLLNIGLKSLKMFLEPAKGTELKMVVLFFISSITS